MPIKHINEGARQEGRNTIYRTLCGVDLPEARALADEGAELAASPLESDCPQCRTVAVANGLIRNAQLTNEGASNVPNV